MTRTRRYKLQYAGVLLAVLALAGVLVVQLRDRPVVLFAVAAAALVPGRVSGYLWRDLYRGRRLLEAGDLHGSLEASRRFVRLLTSRPRLRGLWWLAWASYSRDPMAMALNNIGAAQLELGALDEAEAALREALAVDPEYAIAHFNLAIVASVRDEPAQAERHARRAVELGYARDAGDRMLHAASSLLARIEGRGPGFTASPHAGREDA